MKGEGAGVTQNSTLGKCASFAPHFLVLDLTPIPLFTYRYITSPVKVRFCPLHIVRRWENSPL